MLVVPNKSHQTYRRLGTTSYLMRSLPVESVLVSPFGFSSVCSLQNVAQMLASPSTGVQILHTPIYKTNKFLGSGLLCVIATSFAFLPTTQSSIDKLMSQGKTFDEAYGSLLGVFMVGAVFQSLFSMIPGPRLRKIFPSWLAGKVLLRSTLL